jgi:hypothetical protein
MEANDYTWLRSQLRRISRRWPPVYKALANAKVPYTGDNKRKKWWYECADCKQLFDGKNVSVDHIEPVGTLLKKSDIADFIEKLFCSVDKLQVLCDNCHDLKTYMERYGVDRQSAIIEKKVIAFGKLSTEEQKQKLTEIYGSDKISSLTNKSKRLAAYKEWLKGAHE